MTTFTMILWTAIATITPASAAAHAFDPTSIELRETARGRVVVAVRHPPSGESGSTDTHIRPKTPEGCANASDVRRSTHRGAVYERWSLRCPERALAATTVEVEGLEPGGGGAFVRLVPLGAEAVTLIATADQPSVARASATPARTVALRYVALGVEHILIGADHLWFVLGLLIIAGFGRRLVATIKAFTVGHSVTLALTVLEVVAIPQSIVEILIAASILVLALELAQRREPHATLARRAPWAIAGLFGLLHGAGFAGALAEIGLPEHHIPLALGTFNVGVELGQLLFVGFVGAGAWVAARLVAPRTHRALRATATYAMGGCAMFWIGERTFEWLGSLGAL
jgi:hydrogenase/urease accessory protein HupE